MTPEELLFLQTYKELIEASDDLEHEMVAAILELPLDYYLAEFT
jgi:hypothetical protein